MSEERNGKDISKKDKIKFLDEENSYDREFIDDESYEGVNERKIHRQLNVIDDKDFDKMRKKLDLDKKKNLKSKKKKIEINNFVELFTDKNGKKADNFEKMFKKKTNFKRKRGRNEDNGSRTRNYNKIHKDDYKDNKIIPDNNIIDGLPKKVVTKNIRYNYIQMQLNEDKEQERNIKNFVKNFKEKNNININH